MRRLLVVSAGPVGPQPEGDGPLDRTARAVISALLKDVYADLGAMEAELAGSASDWTVVRPPRLQDKPVTGAYRTVVGGFPARGRFIGRADVAHAMLALAGDPGTVKQGWVWRTEACRGVPAPAVPAPCRSPQAALYRLTPTVTGSLTSVMPKASRTPATISRASASRSSVVASPRLVRARVCLVEMRAGPVP